MAIYHSFTSASQNFQGPNMYIPKQYRITDEAQIFRFMQRYPFATIVTAGNGRQTATHLPFVVSRKNDTILLTSHFAKANPQWQALTSGEALVIFSEPHAYISPRHYESEANVPTWNYLAVHAYGIGKLLLDPEDAVSALEVMIRTFEQDNQGQWEALPQTFKSKMLNGIVAFEIEVSEVQAKKKLSQNRSETERQSITVALTQSSHDVERQTGTYMKQDLLRGRQPIENREAGKG